MSLFRRSRVYDDLSDEIRQHLEEKVDALVAEGMSREDAVASARREFGNVTLIEERGRDVWRRPFLDDLAADLRYGLRMLRKTPAFTITAVLTLALGIGANTAIFTLLDAVMLQNLPVKDPGRLVLFDDGLSEGSYSGHGFRTDYFSYPSWEYFREHCPGLAAICAFRQGTDRLVMHMVGSSEKGPKEQATGHLVSGEYFGVLGVDAAAGRVLTPGDDAPGAPNAAVLSYTFWQKRFGGDRSVIGRAVELNGGVFTIVGAASREFFGERVREAPDFWLPLTRQPQVMQRESLLRDQDTYWLNFMGRLNPGVAIAQAQAALDTELHRFYTAREGDKISDDNRRQLSSAHLQLKPGGRGISWMRVMYSEPLHVLTAVVALVLLIACANVATLLFARGSARRRELFARLALGASRVRLFRQLLTESVLLACMGGAAGVLLAWWSSKALAVTVGLSEVVKVRPNALVLCFTCGVSILTGVVFGLLPALRGSRLDFRTGSALKTGELGATRSGATRALVVLQVAVSSVLVVSAGLLAHTLVTLESQNLGYSSEKLLLVSTDPRLAGYKVPALFGLYQRFQDRLERLPGVRSFALARHSPVSGSSSTSNFTIEGYREPAGAEMDVSKVEVGPRFFETMEIPIVLGRPIGPRDTPASPTVVVVNQTFVRQFFPHQNPLGRRFSLGSPYRAPGAEIVGVAADSKFYNLREMPKPMAFFAAWQSCADTFAGRHWGGRESYFGELIFRTSGDAAGVSAEVRKALGEIDPRLPVLKVTTLREQTRDSLGRERMIAKFCGSFALLALVLASIGLYGTVSYSVARRTNEFGIRMALGAQQSGVLWLVLRESLVLLLVGLVLGLPLAAAAGRSIKSFLYGVAPVDPVAVSAAVVLMAAFSLLAGYVPARRATKVDPSAALRSE